MAANLNWFLRYQMLEHESILCQTEVYNVQAATSQRTMEEEMIQSLFREVYTEHTVKTGLVFPLGIGRCQLDRSFHPFWSSFYFAISFVPTTLGLIWKQRGAKPRERKPPMKN